MAQQEAQRAQFFVEKAKQEKQQKVVQAEGEAQAAKLVSFVRAGLPGWTSGALSPSFRVYSDVFTPTGHCVGMDP